MQFFVLLLLIFVSTRAAKPRSINLALDTVLEFDKSSDVEFIDRVQGILTKVKNVIKNNPKQDVESARRVKRFMEEVIDTVLSFNDDDLKEIVEIVNNEIRKIDHNNPLQENFRRHLRNELDSIKVKPAITIRKKLDRLLRKVQKDYYNNIFGFTNTLNKREAQDKLAKYIMKLKMLRQNSPKSKELQHIIRQAVQCVIDYFFNLSKDTKRNVVARVKDYFRDEFSTTHNDKIYHRIQKQPRKVKKGPESVLQNSEDTKSVEIIDIEEISLKSHHDKYQPQLIQDRSEDTEFSTKTFGKHENVTVEKDNEEAVSIEKLTIRESNAISEESNIKSKYFFDNNPKVTYIKDKRGHNNKTKTRSKNANIKHSKGKLTHIMTLYPGNIEMENRNSKVRFKAKVPLKEGKINEAKKDKTLNYVAISHSAEINVHLKNDKIQFSFDDSKDHRKKDALMKVRAFRQKLIKSRTTRDNKNTNELHSENLNFKTNKFASPKSSFAYFGNLFKSTTVDQSDSRQFFGSNIEDKSETGNIENFNEVSMYRRGKEANTTKNKPDKKLKTIEITTDSYDRLAQEHYIEENDSKKIIETYENNEKLEEFNFMENKPNKILKTIEITTDSNYFLNNGGHGGLTKEPKIIDEVSLNITTDDINVTRKSNIDMDNKTIPAIDEDNSLEPTNSKKIQNIDAILPPVSFYPKAEKNINKDRIYSNKITKKTVENKATHRKIFRQFTNTAEKLPIKFTHTKNGDINKFININLRRGIQETDYTKMQSDFKNNNKNNLSLNLNSNQTTLHYLRRELNDNSKITTSINKNNKSNIGDIVKIVNIQKVNRRQTVVNPKLTTKSYKIDTKKINDHTINGSRTKSTFEPRTTAVVSKGGNLDQELQINNEINSTDFNLNSFDIKKTINGKDIKLNNTKINVPRRQFNVNPKTTTLLVFKDENLDTEFKKEVGISENDPISFDIKQYLKNPEVSAVEDEKKKKEIEQKMKEELGNLLTSPATNATRTEAYTDIFEVMDNEFDLGPLK